MIDLHFHILPGVDDGPRTDAEMLELARAAVASGTRTVVATPHVNWEYRNDAAQIADSVRRARERLAEARIPLQVVPGAEIAASLAIELDDEELRRLSLGGAGWLLIECPHSGISQGLDVILFAIQNRGHRILLAHPERCPGLARDPDLVERLVGTGMATSVTAGVLTGHFGSTVQRAAETLARRGLVHNVASDAHDMRRRPELGEVVSRTLLAEHLDLLVREVPTAILAGKPVPAAARVSEGRPARWRRRIRASR